MEEIMLRRSGLEMVESSKLTAIKGGIGWGGLGGLAYSAYRIASGISKYMPSFIKGFQKGWNAR